MDNLKEEIQDYIVNKLKLITALLDTSEDCKTEKGKLKKFLEDSTSSTLDLAGTNIGDKEVEVLAEIAPDNISGYDLCNTHVDPSGKAVEILAKKHCVLSVTLRDPTEYAATKLLYTIENSVSPEHWPS